MTTLKTGAQVREEFLRNGVSIGSWAKANGFKRSDVYAVLDGKNKMKYGKAHEIAVALGMKDGVVVAPANFLPAQRAMQEAA